MKPAGRRLLTDLAARAVTVPAAAFAVHQLRYLLAYGGHAGAELTDTGHSYLHSVVPWIVASVGLSVGGFLWALGRVLAGRRSAPARTGSFVGLWLVCALCLVAIFCTQELLEGLLATGHPGGFAGIFGYGGWWAIPAAGGVGLVLATLFDAASWTLCEVIRRRGQRRRAWPRAVTVRDERPREAHRPRLAPVRDGWSVRGPPAVA